MLTFGELFAGIGGFSLGLERAGMNCKWQVEIDPYATAVLKKHWPQVPKHDDVRTFPPQGDYSVDLICGGFPCQDISVAGKGAGLAGARSGLWHEFARIIRTVRPRWVVIENVPALTARGLGTVLGDLAEIGFDAEWHCIPACAVGAPHRRDRIWIVAYANGQQRSCGDITSADLERDVCGAAQLCDRQRQATAPLDAMADSIGEPDAVRGHGQAVPSGVAGRCCNAGRGECDSGARCAGRTGQGAGDVADSASVGHEGRAHAQRGRSPCKSERSVRGESGGRSEVLADSKCFAHQQQHAGDVQRRRQDEAQQTWVGCCRDESGSAWWATEPDVGRVAHGVPSRVHRLRCLGNAVVPQVVEIIGRAIIAHEERQRTASQRS